MLLPIYVRAVMVLLQIHFAKTLPHKAHYFNGRRTLNTVPF